MSDNQDNFPEITWALDQIAEARLRRAQGIVDACPLDDPAALLRALEHREEIRAAAARTAGWRRAA